jgi:hypothetical protein
LNVEFVDVGGDGNIRGKPGFAKPKLGFPRLKLGFPKPKLGFPKQVWVPGFRRVRLSFAVVFRA